MNSLDGLCCARFSERTCLALTDVPVNLKDRPDGLRDAVVDYFAVNDW